LGGSVARGSGEHSPDELPASIASPLVAQLRKSWNPHEILKAQSKRHQRPWNNIARAVRGRHQRQMTSALGTFVLFRGLLPAGDANLFAVPRKRSQERPLISQLIVPPYSHAAPPTLCRSILVIVPLILVPLSCFAQGNTPSMAPWGNRRSLPGRHTRGSGSGVAGSLEICPSPRGTNTAAARGLERFRSRGTRGPREVSNSGDVLPGMTQLRKTMSSPAHVCWGPYGTRNMENDTKPWNMSFETWPTKFVA